MADIRRFIGLVALVGITFYLPKLVSDGGMSHGMRSLLRTSPHDGQPQDGSVPATRLASMSSDESWQSETRPLGIREGTQRTPSAGPPIAIQAPAVSRQLLRYEEFLRFDVTPDWITHHFDRVTVLPTPGGEGMRVALLTGTRPNDLVGSLTYFFDEKEMVQRIVIEGGTSDPAELIAFVQKHYKLKEAGRGVYVRQSGKTILAAMLIQRSPVIEKDLQGQRVTLELNRPENYARLSAELHQRLFKAAGS